MYTLTYFEHLTPKNNFNLGHIWHVCSLYYKHVSLHLVLNLCGIFILLIPIPAVVIDKRKPETAHIQSYNKTTTNVWFCLKQIHCSYCPIIIPEFTVCSIRPYKESVLHSEVHLYLFKGTLCVAKYILYVHCYCLDMCTKNNNI